MDKYEFEWSDIAFGNKKPLKDLKAVLIAAPREISSARFTELIKKYIPNRDIVLTIAKEDYVLGYEGQPQFRTLKTEQLSQIDKLNKSQSPHKIYVVNHFQRDLGVVIEKLKPSMCVFINGSWKNSFHTLPIYYQLTTSKIDFELLSPFVDEKEAMDYGLKIDKEIAKNINIKKSFSGREFIKIIEDVASQSFDYVFQTGLILAKKSGDKYNTLVTAYNQVVPYACYALHNGSARENNFSPPNDLNHYDAVHAEMSMLVQAQKAKLNLKNTTLFINLLPCPTCARTLCLTDIEEIVYVNDHSNGYAVKLLESCGKTVRRLV